MQLRGWAPEFHIRLIVPPTRPLRPVIPINACTLRITAAAGTELAGASLRSTLTWFSCSLNHFALARKSFTTRKPSSLTQRRFVRLSPIAKDSRLQPPVGVWAVLSPSVGGQSLNPPRRLSLGAPLPHQLADIPWTYPLPQGLFTRSPTLISYNYLSVPHSVLAPVSSRYPQVKGKLFMYY